MLSTNESFFPLQNRGCKKKQNKKKEKIIYEKVLLNFFAANIKICSHRLFVDIFFPLTFPPFSRFCYSLFSVYILFTLFAWSAGHSSSIRANGFVFTCCLNDFHCGEIKHRYGMKQYHDNGREYGKSLGSAKGVQAMYDFRKTFSSCFRQQTDTHHVWWMNNNSTASWTHSHESKCFFPPLHKFVYGHWRVWPRLLGCCFLFVFFLLLCISFWYRHSQSAWTNRNFAQTANGSQPFYVLHNFYASRSSMALWRWLHFCTHFRLPINVLFHSKKWR